MEILSPVFGTFAYASVETGMEVVEGEEVGAVESMKTMFQLYAPNGGEIMWDCELGEIVAEGQVIAKVV